MKHLVIAGNGFVGEELAKMARNSGWQVTTLSRNGEGDLHVDLSSEESVQAFAESVSGVTHIVHCASAGGGGVEAYRSVYLLGAKYLVNTFPQAHILFTSSTSVYPQTDGSVVDECSSTELERETGKLLLAAEQEVLAAHGTVARLAGIYGVGRSYLLRRFLAGEAVIEEEGSRILNHIDHRDAASAVLYLLEHGEQSYGEIYNVCDNVPKSQRQTYAELCELFERPMPPSAPRNLNSKRGWSDKAVSNAKIRALGWEPEFPEFTKTAKQIAETLR